MLLNKSTVKRKASGENNKVGVEMELETEGNEHLPNRQAALSLHSPPSGFYKSSPSSPAHQPMNSKGRIV